LKAILALDALITKDQHGKPNLKVLDSKAQGFYHKTIRPVTLCLENCFLSNKEELLKFHPKFPYSNWKTHCKASKGTKCQTIVVEE
jgi:hypothetical protein